MPIISTIEGDLVSLAKSGRYTEIAHGCNCHGVMGAGVALQIANAFKMVREVDKPLKGEPISRLATMTLAFSTVADNKVLTIYNLYTQLNYGSLYTRGVPDVDYNAISVCFKKLNYMLSRKIYPENRKQLLGIPMIGSERAGGDWNKIVEIINEATPNIDLELVVYKPS